MIKVALASHDDLDAILTLLHAMDRHYGGDAFDAALARRHLAPLLDRSPHACVFLARLQGQAIGFATVYEMFPGAGTTTQWYVKELYVEQAARGLGAGEALMRAAARHAESEGGKRLDLVADAANLRGRAFYERLGAVAMDRIYYRYEGAALGELSQKQPS